MMDVIGDEQFERLLGLIYRAAIDPDLWAEFVVQLSDMMGGTMVVMHAHDTEANLALGAISSAVDEGLLREYDQYYAAKNVWVPGISQMAVGIAGHPEDALDRGELLKSEFYNDWLKPLGGYNTASGIVLHRSPDRFLILSGNIRSRDADRLRTPLRQLLDRLAPHIVQSFEVSRGMAARTVAAQYRMVGEFAFDPIFFLDRQARITFANHPAECILRTGRVVKLDKAGQLSFVDRAANMQFGRSLTSIKDQRLQGITGSFFTRSSVGRVQVSLAPCDPDGPLPGAMQNLPDETPMVILSLKTNAARHTFVGETFGFTKAEAALALALSHGLSMRTYASENGLSQHTVRSHLRALFEKTNTHRQGELISVLLSSSV